MKRSVFSLCLTLAVVVAVGSVLYYGRTLHRTFSDGSVHVVDDPTQEEEGIASDEELLAPLQKGAYVLYQLTRQADAGEQLVANDDTKETIVYRHRLGADDAEPLKTISTPFSSAGPFVELFGDSVLIHDWEQRIDTHLALDGTFQTRPQATKRYHAPVGSTWIEYTQDDENVNVTFFEGDTQEETIVLSVDAFEEEVLELVVPIGLTQDGRRLYLREGASVIDGVWSYDRDEETLKRYASEEMFPPFVSSGAEQLIGTMYEVPSVGALPEGPSVVQLMDLATGAVRTIAYDEDRAFVDPILSPDGTQYAVVDPTTNIISVTSVKDQPNFEDRLISGRLLDWVGNMLVLERDRELIVFDPRSRAVNSIAQSIGSYGDPDWQDINYIGIIEYN